MDYLPARLFDFSQFDELTVHFEPGLFIEFSFRRVQGVLRFIEKTFGD